MYKESLYLDINISKYIKSYANKYKNDLKKIRKLSY